LRGISRLRIPPERGTALLPSPEAMAAARSALISINRSVKSICRFGQRQKREEHPDAKDERSHSTSPDHSRRNDQESARCGQRATAFSGGRVSSRATKMRQNKSWSSVPIPLELKKL
jgi:hypothetical protein